MTSFTTSQRALICGISGQDGAYLAKFLLDKGYEVYGTSRDAQVTSFANLNALGILSRVRVVSMALTDFRSVLQTIKHVQPTEIYNLAGQSSVGLSFEQPVETLESISTGTLNLLESIRLLNIDVSFYNASSGECFGDTGELAADENTAFKPRSPYAVAKCAAYWQVASYRDAYRLRCCSGIMFNHESPLRQERFVTQKIVRAASRIANGASDTLRLGNLEIERDWGWAPDYVQAMWLMLQQTTCEDFVIATGESHSLSSFVDIAFSACGLDWRRHVVVDSSLLRPSDPRLSRANPERARKKLGWTATKRMPDVVRAMLDKLH